MKAKVPNCDVFSSTDLGQYVTLRQQKHLLAFKPKRLAECESLARDFDPTNQITITDANTTVMCYNPSLVKAEDAPKKWTDLLDPGWAPTDGVVDLVAHGVRWIVAQDRAR